MRAYNTTTGASGPRPSETFTFQLPPGTNKGASVKSVGVQRLLANGSDAITGITFDGYSYNYELDEGRPVVLNNVTRNEVVQVTQNGMVTVDVPWSSAVILNLHW